MFLGPALVHYKPSNGTNLTQTFLTLDPTNVSNGTQSRDDVKASIDIYMDILAGVSVLLFGLFVLYFPSKPPQPPAFSSAIERTELESKRCFPTRTFFSPASLTVFLG